MPGKPIDVWNLDTFDRPLLAILEAHADLIRSYTIKENDIFLEHDYGRGKGRSLMRPENPHAGAFIQLRERLAVEMGSRTIRTWHYTRLTDAEVDLMRRDGIQLSTPETLRARLAAMTVACVISPDDADAIYKASPFHSDQRKNRSGKFCLVSHPLSINNGGVEPLLGHWGGEVAYFWLQDGALLKLLGSAGRPRVVEIAVPLKYTKLGLSAGNAVLATFGRSLGCVTSKHDFDVFVEHPLPPGSILAIHTEGDAKFPVIGQGYPHGFVDVSQGYWKELTGED